MLFFLKKYKPYGVHCNSLEFPLSWSNGSVYTRITCGVCPTNRLLDIISDFWLAGNCWGLCLSQESSDDVQADLLGSHLRSALVLWGKMRKKSSNLSMAQNQNSSYLFCHLGYNNKNFSSSSSSFSSFSSSSFIPLKSEFQVAPLSILKEKCLHRVWLGSVLYSTSCLVMAPHSQNVPERDRASKLTSCKPSTVIIT